jgi:hypothetical protein
MARHHEPNGSYYSARYAERKRAAQRARDALPRRDEPCRACGNPVPSLEMDTLCKTCRDEFCRIATGQSLDAAEMWVADHIVACSVRRESEARS